MPAFRPARRALLLAALALPAFAPAATAQTYPSQNVTVLVDRKASLFLIGTVMDYEVKNLTSGFTFTNPNEKGRCGCGESFHV